jgi:DNA-binding transcriptional MerR regulator
VAKAPDAFLTIGEMAERLSVRTHILRYWEEQFPMLQPLKRAGGRRLYRPADVALLEQIKDLLERQGFTIRGARLFLQSGSAQRAEPSAPAATVIAPVTAANPVLPMIVQELRAVRSRLATALEHA